jgi:hypothetical protein
MAVDADRRRFRAIAETRVANWLSAHVQQTA